MCLSLFDNDDTLVCFTLQEIPHDEVRVNLLLLPTLKREQFTSKIGLTGEPTHLPSGGFAFLFKHASNARVKDA